ncbi:MAG: MerR family transcriptional regulator, repressor of the yfmOP operon [Thermoleophilaceae bacterium]|nr:MerR family transcriptional regulator, repressor of the yfmOP operon [Thermoleophilaceae bacterium]
MNAAAAAPPLRIGDVARQVGTTTRTIRYYEEIGLLPGGGGRPAGGHRVYTETDVERLREIVRLKDLLGVSLEELKALVEAEDARALLRREWHEGEPDPQRREQILTESLGHLDHQLTLVRRRRAELDKLEQELIARRRRVRSLLREAGAS